MRGNWMVAVAMGTAMAQKAETRITIALYDIAGLRSGILTAMKMETSSIFREAGIDLDWEDCARSGKPLDNPECGRPYNSAHLMLRVLPGVNKAMPGAAGLAIVQGDASVVAFLYPQRVTELASGAGWDFGDLLGHSAAHELGHLLLRSAGHSEGGIMRASWEVRDLRRLSHAGLVFLRGQLRPEQLVAIK